MGLAPLPHVSLYQIGGPMGLFLRLHLLTDLIKPCKGDILVETKL